MNLAVYVFMHNISLHILQEKGSSFLCVKGDGGREVFLSSSKRVCDGGGDTDERA